MLASVLSLALAGISALASAIPAPDVAANNDRLVFCHFMVSPLSPSLSQQAQANKPKNTQIGITSNRHSASDYDDDMKRAKALGIDAFALNIGVDPYTDAQLNLAYESAANNDMKVFISFDFNWYHTGQAAAVGEKVKQYASRPAQLKVDGKVFVSSFAGDGIDVAQIKASAGQDIFFAPNFHPGQGDFGAIDGALNWMAWDNDGNNKAPTPGHNVTVADGDKAYNDALNGKPYIARETDFFSFPLKYHRAEKK